MATVYGLKKSCLYIKLLKVEIFSWCRWNFQVRLWLFQSLEQINFSSLDCSTDNFLKNDGVLLWLFLKKPCSTDNVFEKMIYCIYWDLRYCIEIYCIYCICIETFFENKLACRLIFWKIIVDSDFFMKKNLFVRSDVLKNYDVYWDFCFLKKPCSMDNFLKN